MIGVTAKAELPALVSHRVISGLCRLRGPAIVKTSANRHPSSPVTFDISRVCRRGRNGSSIKILITVIIKGVWSYFRRSAEVWLLSDGERYWARTKPPKPSINSIPGSIMVQDSALQLCSARSKNFVRLNISALLDNCRFV